MQELIFPSRRPQVSGFTGSAGTAVFTREKAALWTDGRYFLQANQELDSDWTLMKDGIPGTLSIEDWLIEQLPEGINYNLKNQLTEEIQDQRSAVMDGVPDITDI